MPLLDVDHLSVRSRWATPSSTPMAASGSGSTNPPEPLLAAKAIEFALGDATDQLLKIGATFAQERELRVA